MNQFYSQEALKQIQGLKHIPPGKFISIDEKYYNPVPEYITSNESYGNQRPLEPHGVSVNYQATPFIKRASGLNLNPLNQNYGSYIYNQETGYQ